MADYETNRRFADQWFELARQTVGPFLLVPTPMSVDTNCAGDMWLIRARNMLIACRIRRHGYAASFPYDFTLRSRGRYGHETEFQKIKSGWADWMFYAHANADDATFARWMLLDLAAVRAALIDGDARYSEKHNGDGTSFVTFNVCELPSRVLVGASHPIPFAAQQPDLFSSKAA